MTPLKRLPILFLQKAKFQQQIKEQQELILKEQQQQQQQQQQVTSPIILQGSVDDEDSPQPMAQEDEDQEAEDEDDEDGIMRETFPDSQEMMGGFREFAEEIHVLYISYFSWPLESVSWARLTFTVI